MEREESKMCKGNTCEFCMFADISPMSKLDTICLNKNSKNYRKIVPTFSEKDCMGKGKNILLRKP